MSCVASEEEADKFNFGPLKKEGGKDFAERRLDVRKVRASSYCIWPYVARNLCVSDQGGGGGGGSAVGVSSLAITSCCFSTYSHFAPVSPYC